MQVKLIKNWNLAIMNYAKIQKKNMLILKKKNLISTIKYSISLLVWIISFKTLFQQIKKFEFSSSVRSNRTHKNHSNALEQIVRFDRIELEKISKYWKSSDSVNPCLIRFGSVRFGSVGEKSSRVSLQMQKTIYRCIKLCSDVQWNYRTLINFRIEPNRTQSN
jgi:hypothetical protein